MTNVANNPALLSALVALCALAASAALLVARRARGEARDLLALALQFEAELADASRDHAASSRRADELARRVARLETRARPAAADKCVDEERAAPAQPSKTTITERRHRVTQLARKGVSTDSIASLLNMPHGEVELIIGLSRAA